MKLSAEQAQRLSRAVEVAESKTSLELVVTLLPRSRAYLLAPAALGVAAALITLGLVLFLEEPEVDPAVVTPLVGLAGIVCTWLASLLPVRWVSRAPTRAAAVETQAHAAFSRQGVHGTTGRTGVLVLLSLAEGEARVVADRGVVTAIPEDVRREWQSQLSAVAARFDVEQLAKEVEAMGARAGGYLPRQKDDVDELPNAPVEARA
jgi:putative membrane protein